MSPAANTPALPGALTPAWHEDGTPFSPEYGDVYYSRDGGLEESQHVFLAPSALEGRFRALAPGALFLIGETGFGTGLNFLLACEAWRACAPRDARLVYRSLEAHPLERDALARALAQWPRLAPLSEALIVAWPPPLAGLHCLEPCEGVQLQLYVGDVEQALDEFLGATDEASVDAWFLDGFAPTRNPAMWSASVLARVGASSRPGATVATFSAAAAVRTGLEQAGFRLRKLAGFGRKREMLCGERTEAQAPEIRPLQPVTPWHRADESRADDVGLKADPQTRDALSGACGSGFSPTSSPRDALVIGAGIAGCATARALARRGFRVTVLEAADTIAAGASGNPQAILFTQLPAGDSAHGEFTLASYLYATRYYARLLAANDRASCGMLQLHAQADADFARLRARYAALPALARAVDREQATQIAGVEVASGGLFFPDSGWIDPRAACAAALEHARIRVHCGEPIVSIARDGERWVAASRGASWSASVVVLANARAAGSLWPRLGVALEPVRGQLTLLPESSLPGTPRCVVCDEGYVIPPRAGLACCGASFRRGEEAGPPSLHEHQSNLAQLAAIVPRFDAGSIDPPSLGARVAERCATPDRLPLAGRMPDLAAFRRRFAALRANARRVIAQRGAFEPGLFVNAGHGSRGMTSAPLAAELIAAELAGEPLPVTQRVARALSPARFVVRDIVRGVDT